jgi:hypothetical protein
VPLKTEKGNKDIVITKSMIDKLLVSTNKNLDKITRTDRNVLLRNETTAVAVLKELHKSGRTYGGRNQSEQYINDAYNLKNATKLDIGFALYYLKEKRLYDKYNKYLENSKILIRRNFELCLYQ